MSNLENTSLYINGAWQPGFGAALVSTNPIDGSTVWQGHQPTTKQVQQTFVAAQQASLTWRQVPITERIGYLEAFAKQVDQHRQALAELISREHGKPLWESLTEVAAVIGKVQLSIQAYQERCAEKLVSNQGVQSGLRYKPLGVVAVLGPFNFPAHLSNGHIVPALLAGNTVILKPSELTPAVAAFIMQCWHETGIPPGVINCLQGSGAVAVELLNQPVQGVFFTGSYQTGKKIHQQFAGRPEIMLALEMGGNNPLIVEEVNDLPAAVYHTLLSAYLTAGQRCTCVRRLFIPESPWGKRFTDALLAAASALSVGSYLQRPEPFMGPVISFEHATAHLHAQQQLINLGGDALLSMQLLKEHSGLLSPGVIDMTGVDRVPDEEIFAPLIQLYRYQSFEEALFQANQTRYGLSAGLISDSPSRYEQFYQTIQAGLINWNKPTTGAASNLPFGGIGSSGNHRPSAYFAADYCAYPIASQEQALLAIGQSKLPGVIV